MSRLFTFGCSFTEYIWPTWADILGRQFKEYYNYGRCGSGNQFIFNSIVESNLVHKFRDTDTIAIMWTNVSREDRYVKGDWIVPGNIYTQDTYDEKFVERFSDLRGYYIRDLAVIWATDQLLEKIGCKVIYFSMADMISAVQYVHKDSTEDIQDLLEYYQPVLDKIRPSVHRTIFNYDWWGRPNLSLVNYFNLKDRLKFRSWYESIRNPDWPDCKSKSDFLSLPAHILQECRDRFNSNECFKEIPRPEIKHPPRSRGDLHPSPKEHLEYLDIVAPEITISQKCRDWIEKIDNLLQNCQDYFDLWLPKLPQRW